MSSEKFLDAQGLLCPLPILRARKILNTLSAGDVLRIRATDAGALRDFPLFCEQTGHSLTGISQNDDGVIEILIRAAGAPPSEA